MFDGLEKLTRDDAMHQAQLLADVTAMLRSTARFLGEQRKTPMEDQAQAEARDRIAELAAHGPVHAQAVILMLAGIIVNCAEPERIAGYVQLQMAAIDQVMRREEGL